MDIRAEAAQIRSDGSLLGAAEHRVRQAKVDPMLEADLVEHCGPGMRITSAWVNHYEPGSFVALHQDRTGSDLTALRALDEVADPTVLCIDYVGLSGDRLLEMAKTAPFPAGLSVIVPQDRFLFVRGAEVPHHRPPATGRYRVLAVTLSRVSG